MLKIFVILAIQAISSVQCENHTGSKLETFLKKVEKEFPGYKGRPMPKELEDIFNNTKKKKEESDEDVIEHQKAIDEIEECTYAFSNCLAVGTFNKPQVFCGLREATKSTKLFENVCEFAYRLCRDGNNSWTCVPESECIQLRSSDNNFYSKYKSDIFEPIILKTPEPDNRNQQMNPNQGQNQNQQQNTNPAQNQNQQQNQPDIIEPLIPKTPEPDNQDQQMNPNQGQNQNKQQNTNPAQNQNQQQNQPDMFESIIPKTPEPDNQDQQMNTNQGQNQNKQQNTNPAQNQNQQHNQPDIFEPLIPKTLEPDNQDQQMNPNQGQNQNKQQNTNPAQNQNQQQNPNPGGLVLRDINVKITKISGPPKDVNLSKEKTSELTKLLARVQQILV